MKRQTEVIHKTSMNTSKSSVLSRLMREAYDQHHSSCGEVLPFGVSDPWKSMSPQDIEEAHADLKVAVTEAELQRDGWSQRFKDLKDHQRVLEKELETMDELKRELGRNGRSRKAPASINRGPVR